MEKCMLKNELYSRILLEIENISIIDTHEHIVSENIREKQKIDLFNWFSHYASSDLRLLPVNNNLQAVGIRCSCNGLKHL